MNRAIIPMGALAAAGLVLMTPAPAPVVRPVSDLSTPPVVSGDLRIPVRPDVIAMQRIAGARRDGPGQSGFAVPEARGWGGHTDMEPEAVVARSESFESPSRAGRSERDPLDMLGDALGDPTDALIAPGMDPERGWGWLADDVRSHVRDDKVKPAASRLLTDDPFARPLPGDEPDDPFDVLNRGRSSAFRPEGGR